MKIYLVGTGMDGCETLTKAARDAVDKAELLIGAARMLEPFSRLDKQTVCEYDPAKIAAVADSESVHTAAVLLSGDTGFFSGAKKLITALSGHDVEVICGISSAAYLCSRLGVGYEDMKFVTLHGREGNIAVNVRMNERCFFLLGGELDAAAVCKRLCEYGLSGVRVHIGERLGSPDERITSGLAAELTEIETQKLCVLMTEDPQALRHVPSAIADGEFLRGDIPMTKAVVRGSIVSGLMVGRDSVCWDIGCGTGSVSAELAFRCPDGKVYAFDKKPEAVELTLANARRFGCDNIFARQALCPEFPEDIPAPDKVFIGGSSGNIAEIVGAVYELNSSADITAAAVSLETLSKACEAFGAAGREYTVTQLAVTETHRIGTHTMFRAQNPVFIISAVSGGVL